MMQKEYDCGTPNKRPATVKTTKEINWKLGESRDRRNSFSATTLTPLSFLPNTSALSPTNLQSRVKSLDDSWLLSKVSGSQGLQQPQLYKHLACSWQFFPPKLEGKHQKWWDKMLNIHLGYNCSQPLMTQHEWTKCLPNKMSHLICLYAHT